MRADNVYFEMFYIYVYSEYMELQKSESIALLGSIIYSDPWTADLWGELFIAATDASENDRTDMCAYSAMVGTIRSYAFRTKNEELKKLSDNLIDKYQINEVKFHTWLKLKEQAISNIQSKGCCLLYGEKDWKTDYLSALIMDDHGFVNTKIR